jgi:hypothetical protein
VYSCKPQLEFLKSAPGSNRRTQTPVAPEALAIARPPAVHRRPAIRRDARIGGRSSDDWGAQPLVSLGIMATRRSRKVPGRRGGGCRWLSSPPSPIGTGCGWCRWCLRRRTGRAGGFGPRSTRMARRGAEVLSFAPVARVVRLAGRWTVRGVRRHDDREARPRRRAGCRWCVCGRHRVLTPGRFPQ